MDEQSVSIAWAGTTDSDAGTVRLVVGPSDDLEAVDVGEVAGVACVDREVVGDRGRRDHRVIRAGCGLTTSAAQRGRDSAERPRCGGIERQRVKVCFSLLKMRLARGALLLVSGDERPD
jgi:hypothetical protein